MPGTGDTTMSKTDSVLLSLELAYVLVTKTINKSLQAVRTTKKIKKDDEIDSALCASGRLTFDGVVRQSSYGSHI